MQLKKCRPVFVLSKLLGKSSRSQNRRSVVATAMELFDPLREHFAAQADAKALKLRLPAFFVSIRLGLFPRAAARALCRAMDFGEEIGHAMSCLLWVPALPGPALAGAERRLWELADFIEMRNSATLYQSVIQGFGPDAVHIFQPFRIWDSGPLCWMGRPPHYLLGNARGSPGTGSSPARRRDRRRLPRP